MIVPDPFLYTSDNYLVLDVETGGKNAVDPWDTENSTLVLACWFYRGEKYHQFGNEFDQYLLLEHIEKCDYIVAHNAKFELGWLARCGHDVGSKPVWCTQVAQYVMLGNRKSPLTLNGVAEANGLGEQKLSVVDKLIKGGVDCRDIPKDWLLSYCHQDVHMCHRIFAHQRRYINACRLANVLSSRLYLTPVLTDIERRGVHLDKDKVQTTLVDRVSEREQLHEALVKGTGIENLNSPKQLGEYIYSTLKFAIPRDGSGRKIVTPKGDPSCAEPAIACLKWRTKKQRKFLEEYKHYKKLEGMITKYLTKMQQCCEDSGGILRASFNQTVTTTHRLSSTGSQYSIQLQNISRDLKPLINAREEGWRIMEVDFSQLEFRIAVDLGDDEQGKKDIAEERDVHAFTASTLFDEFDGADKSEKKKLRTKAKAFTFRPLFGGSSGSPREQQYYAAFKARYSGVTETQDAWVSEAVYTYDSSLVLPTGLRFFYPDLKLQRSGKYKGENQVRNAPIQNFASAEVTLLAVGMLWHWLKEKEMSSFIIATVHDSIILEVHPDELECVGKQAEVIMTKWTPKLIKDLYDYELSVPLEVEVESGTHWGVS